MNRHDFASAADFSRENDFQERLLRRIKRECFAELSDNDLDFVNAAGVIQPGQENKRGLIMIIDDLDS